jgi:hypothetical protein
MLFVFSPSTSYEEALDQTGFEESGSGEGLGMNGGYGSFAVAKPYKAGSASGTAAYTFFRGFIEDASLLHDGESGVFSGEIGHVVLKTPSGQPVAFECHGDTPDEEVDCEPVIQMIGRTLKLTSRP